MIKVAKQVITRQKVRTSCSKLCPSSSIHYGHTLIRQVSFVKHIFTAVCALLLTLQLNTSSAPSAPTAPSFTEQLDAQIKQWITILATEDEFASWNNVRWDVHPLGPGMHGWLVLIHSAISLQEIGYLVVSISERGEWQLVEYGVGDYPLFSEATLQNSMHGDDLAQAERHYYDALQAVWMWPQSQHSFAPIDAVTGEQYAISSLLDHIIAQAMTDDVAATTLTRLSEQRHFPLFDPYEELNWLSDEPLETDHFEQLIAAWTSADEVTYVASVFAGKVTIPLAVIGYHLWDDQVAYVKLDQLSYRFIPFTTLLAHGEFFAK